MNMNKEEKCNHKWYGKRYCRKCGEIEMWGKITGNTAIDLENRLIAGDNLLAQKQDLLTFIKDQKKKHYSPDLIIKHLIDGIKAGEI